MLAGSLYDPANSSPRTRRTKRVCRAPGGLKWRTGIPLFEYTSSKSIGTSSYSIEYKNRSGESINEGEADRIRQRIRHPERRSQFSSRRYWKSSGGKAGQSMKSSPRGVARPFSARRAIEANQQRGVA